MRNHDDRTSMNLRPASFNPRHEVSTTVFEGYIGEVTAESVIVFPRLDRRYSIELRRADVLDFEPGLPTGACRFVVPTSAPVQERVMIRTTARRPSLAAQVAFDVSYDDLEGWIHEAVPE
ncbi:MAG: hypothetical protein WD995_10350 [Gemmatimonadota bacterium]